MPAYTIGFRNGQSIEINVKDGKDFILSISNTIMKNSMAPIQLWADKESFLNITEIDYIMPTAAISKELQIAPRL